jgi:hypothetical protein
VVDCTRGNPPLYPPHPSDSRDRLRPSSAAVQNTVPSLQQLVSNRARIQIRSVQELGKYYREFRLISHNLIKLRRIGVQEQGQHFLAGFEPCLASEIDSQLKIKFLDHCPLDPYRIEDIFDAALYTLRSRPFAPSVLAPRDIVSLSTQFPDAPPLFQLPPQAITMFPRVLERPPVVEAVPATIAQGHANWQPTSLTSTPRDDFSPQVPALGSPLTLKQALRTVEVFPQAQVQRQVDPAPQAPKLPSPAAAHLVYPPRRNPTPPRPAPTASLPAPAVQAPFPQFLVAQQSPPLARPSAALLTKVLASQPSAPSAPPPRDLLSLRIRPSDAFPQFRIPPQAAQLSLPAPFVGPSFSSQCCTCTESPTTCAAQSTSARRFLAANNNARILPSPEAIAVHD